MENLSVACYHILALVKLRLYPEAAAALGKLGDLDSPAYYSASGLSLIPFALRFLYSDLPALVGQQSESVGRLQSLLTWTQARVVTSAAE